MMSTIENMSILWQAQEAAANILNADAELSGKVTFFSENQRDIDFQLKNALGRQGIVGIIMTPTAQYCGNYQDESVVWDLRNFTVQIVENPTVNRAIPTSITALDAAVRATDRLANTYASGFTTYNPVSIEQGEQSGLIVAQARFNCTVRTNRHPSPTDSYAVYTDGSSKLFHVVGNSFTANSVVKQGLRRLYIQEGITILGQNALKDATDLELLQLPSTLTTISFNAVNGCVKLTEVDIPSGVTSIGRSAFSDCSSLVSVTFSGKTMETVKGMANYNWGVPFGCILHCTDGDIEVPITDCFAVYSDGRTVTWHVTGNTFNSYNVDKNGLVSLRIQTDNISTIGINALQGASRLSSVVIPDTVVTIDRNAFEDCTSLSSIVLPESIQRINKQCFQGSTNIRTLNIPESVSYIGEDAFYHCISVDDVYCYPNPNQLDWEEEACDDFKPDGSTRCHVKAQYLSDYQRLFTDEVNVTFVGDL